MIFDLKEVVRHFELPITGTIQVGAFVGEELPAYRELGLYNTILFEPQRHLFDIIQSKCEGEERVYNVALGNNDCDMEMYVSHREGGIEHGSGASSSLLKPRKHLSEHPEVTFPQIITISMTTLDSFISENDINLKEYNFLNIDVQGYELEVLKGATSTLEEMDILLLEVNRDEVYEGCPMIEEIDCYLANTSGFKREHVVWQSESWGDALYLRSNR